MGSSRVDLRFEVAGISDADLAERLQREQRRLTELFGRRVLDVQVGEEEQAYSLPYDPTAGHEQAAAASFANRARGNDSSISPSAPGSPSDDSYLSAEVAAAADAAAALHRFEAPSENFGGPLDDEHEGGASVDHLNHPTTPVGPSFLMSGSYWDQRKGSRIREVNKEEQRRRQEEQSQIKPFRARAVPASVSAPRFQAMLAAAEASRHDVARQSGGSCGSSARAGRRPSSADVRAAAAATAAGAVRAQVRMGDATCHRSDDEDGGGHGPPPFRARPVPWCVSAPLYDQKLIEGQRARRERQAARSAALMRSSSLPPRLEAVRARLCGDVASDGRVLRASTPVPPAQAAHGVPPSVARHWGPGVEHPRPPPSCGQPMAEAADNLARDVAAGGGLGWGGGGGGGAIGAAAAAAGRRSASAGPGHGCISGGGGGADHSEASRGHPWVGQPPPPGAAGWGVSSVYGSSYGLSHFVRSTEPPQEHSQQPEPRLEPQTPQQRRRSETPVRIGSAGTAQQPPYRTTEVPDFSMLHERERQKLERRKYRNRYVTQPEPFVFQRPIRATLRQPALTKDPSRDWRSNRPNSARGRDDDGLRSSGGGGSNRPRSADARGRSASAAAKRALDRPPSVAPPRTTEKALQAQQFTARMLQERREHDRAVQQELEQARTPSFAMKCRVKRAVGTVQPLEEKIERIVVDKRQTRAMVQREKQQALEYMKARVERRPLLMEQTDSLARARRRALFRVRAKLEDDLASHAGLNPDVFRDPEEDSDLA